MPVRTIAFLDADTLGGDVRLDPLATLGDLTVHGATAPAEIRERVAGAHVVLTNKVALDAATLRSCPSLELVVVTASIADKIDLDEARRLGIAVRTARGYATSSVAQFTVGLILTLACRIPYYTRVVGSGEYTRRNQFSHVGAGFVELAGKRVGIVGLGAIGTRIAEIVTALGAEVVYYSTSGRDRDPRFERVSLPVLLATSDVVSLHVPRTAATTNLVDHAALSTMKRTAFLVNVGRGGVVDERDLAAALADGVIAGAALDVFADEPLPPGSPLLALPDPTGLVLTPHCAWGGDGAQAELVRIAYDAVVDHFRGRP